MSGDFSRFSFDPWSDLCGVLSQQGKVQLDSDANTLMAIFERRFRAGTIDTIGKATVPRETPDGFRIDAVAGKIRIHPGRIYVDGLLVENHGDGAIQWEPHLAELRGPDPLDYGNQPYFPDPPQIGQDGAHLVYLDVWQRELTHLQKPDLVEKGLGVDTIAALQTVWQVKVWPYGENNVSCATPLTDLPRWEYLNGPSGGRLTTSAHAEAGPENLCLAPPSGGYTGIQNQHYRIEIHTGGAMGGARFKWSRDNASVGARVLSITGNATLELDSIGKDKLLRFSDGDWVEITDDWRELKGLPGEIRRIKLGGGVDDTTRTVVLDQALPGAAFPVDANGNTQAARHTRIVRWDQKGKVLREDGTVLVDLDAAGSDGLIPIPPAGTRVRIEQGVLVEFDVVAGGTFKSLDYWTFAARSADASVDMLKDAPPRGVHHHYAKLAIVTLPDTETDCRVLWPPLTAGGDCACTVCVNPDEHNSGKATIQEAIDSIEARGGTVCLKPGLYRLREPIILKSRAGVCLRGQGVSTILAGAGYGSLVQVEDARAAALESLVLVGAPNADISYLVTIANVMGFTMREVFALSLGPAPGAVRDVVRLSGVALGIRISDCVLFGEEAIGFSPVGAKDKFLLGAGVSFENNLLLAVRRGIGLEGPVLFTGDVLVRKNTVMGGREAGIVLSGANLEAAAVRVEDNTLNVLGTGIGVGLGDITISNNLYAPPRVGGGDGVTLRPGLLPKGMRHVHLHGNRILHAAQAGIRATVAIGSAIVAENVIENAGNDGIVFDASAPSGSVMVINNRLNAIAPNADGDGVVYCGIRVIRAAQANITNNVILDVGRSAVRARAVAGISAMLVTRLHISGNLAAGIGAPGGFIGIVDGVLLAGPDVDAQISDNSIRRNRDNDAPIGDGRWCGIRVPAFSGTPEAVFLSVSMVTVLLGGTTLVVLNDRIVEPGKLTRDVALRGNRVHAQNSHLPCVLVSDVRTGLFADNQVELALNGGPMEPPVLLKRGAFTAHANVIRSRQNVVTLSLVDATPALAIGNLTTGPVQINGAPLPAPMDLLNLLIP